MIVDLQRRIAEVGRIRTGQKVEGSRGPKPSKLETFRLSSADKTRIIDAAAMFGGQVVPWQAPSGAQWEVITDATAIDVIVPPAAMAFSQSYELWSGGGCERRCDGVTEQISDGPCVCDPEARECKIRSRLSVMISGLRGLGVWRLDTESYYAAVELGAAVEVIGAAAAVGALLPARLRLEQRSVRRPGEPVKRFAVPVLDVAITPGELVGGAVARLEAEPRPALTPVPTTVSTRPVRSIAAQAASVDDEPAPRPRARSAQPIPPTGLAPRTVAELADDELPLPEAPPDESSGPSSTGDGATSSQLRKIGVTMRELGMTERDETLNYVAAAVGRRVGSRTELTRSEASTLIDALAVDQAGWDAPDGAE